MRPPGKTNKANQYPEYDRRASQTSYSLPLCRSLRRRPHIAENAVCIEAFQ